MFSCVLYPKTEFSKARFYCNRKNYVFYDIVALITYFMAIKQLLQSKRLNDKWFKVVWTKKGSGDSAILQSLASKRPIEYLMRETQRNHKIERKTSYYRLIIRNKSLTESRLMWNGDMSSNIFCLFITRRMLIHTKNVLKPMKIKETTKFCYVLVW